MSIFDGERMTVAKELAERIALQAKKSGIDIRELIEELTRISHNYPYEMTLEEVIHENTEVGPLKTMTGKQGWNDYLILLNKDTVSSLDSYEQQLLEQLDIRFGMCTRKEAISYRLRKGVTTQACGKRSTRGLRPATPARVRLESTPRPRR
jgi:hypothetical protein